MFFVILAAMFRWLALFLAGSSLGYLLFKGGALSDTLLTVGFALLVWLMAKGISALMGNSVQLKFLDTKQKRVIAAVASFAMGVIFALTAV